jgi:5-methylcytosine-specific restriction endonuclease McrA
MARPKKLTLDFFIHDADASESTKIRILSRKHGNDGYATFFRVLEKLCSQSGLRLDLKNLEACELVAEDFRLRDAQHLTVIISTCVELGLFDRQLWESERIVFSPGLNERYLERLQDRKRAAERKRRSVDVKNLAEKINAFEQITAQETVNDFVKRKFNHQCVYCLSTLDLSVDHLIPVSQNGTEDLQNLVCACKSCNSRKRNRTPDQARISFANPSAEQQWLELSKIVAPSRNKPCDNSQEEELSRSKNRDNSPELQNYRTTELSELQNSHTSDSDRTTTTTKEPEPRESETENLLPVNQNRSQVDDSKSVPPPGSNADPFFPVARRPLAIAVTPTFQGPWGVGCTESQRAFDAWLQEKAKAEGKANPAGYAFKVIDSIAKGGPQSAWDEFEQSRLPQSSVPAQSRWESDPRTPQWTADLNTYGDYDFVRGNKYAGYAPVPQSEWDERKAFAKWAIAAGIAS